ncbi:hypothetical protein JXA32_02025 [Candidatus Sumerlaeota bacterium]|nr:hypothetical protein [Candidatus Sumerlaeota bacterium]
MDWLMIFVTAVMAIATCGIWHVSNQNNRLIEKLEDNRKRDNDDQLRREEEFRQQISDLYKAIVIASLIKESNLSQALHQFERLYDGKTPINLKLGKNHTE